MGRVAVGNGQVDASVVGISGVALGVGELEGRGVVLRESVF